MARRSKLERTVKEVTTTIRNTSTSVPRLGIQEFLHVLLDLVSHAVGSDHAGDGTFGSESDLLPTPAVFRLDHLDGQ